MKQLEISKLMDEYQDYEFFPEGGSTADIQAVKDRVLSQIAATKKRRTPSLKVVLLAAALAVGCLMSIAAARGGPVVRFITGATIENGVFDGTLTTLPYEFENGRLWFVSDGQHTDITDLIDADTPYIYSHFDPETEVTTYTVVGGVDDTFGWFEYSPDGSHLGSNYFLHYITLDGVKYDCREWHPEFDVGFYPVDMVEHPWTISAEQMLGIDLFAAWH